MTQFLFLGYIIFYIDDSAKILVHCTAYIHSYTATKPFHFCVVALVVMTVSMMAVFWVTGNYIIISLKLFFTQHA